MKAQREYKYIQTQRVSKKVFQGNVPRVSKYISFPTEEGIYQEALAYLSFQDNPKPFPIILKILGSCSFSKSQAMLDTT